MDEGTSKFNKGVSSIESFIRNPLDKALNPNHVASFTLDRRRAKSLLKKIDKANQIERESIVNKAKYELILGFDEILTEMKKIKCSDKNLKRLLRESIYMNSISNEQRKEEANYNDKLWYIASGAMQKKDMSSGYYIQLSQGFKNYPKYFARTIEKDLMRTFPDKLYDPNDPIIIKMRRILNSYAKNLLKRRNPVIGYCQGLNFIIARIIEVIEDEEESFWIFCSLLEDILPIDYFSNMVGVLIDQKIFSEMIIQHDKILARKFSDLEVDSSLFSMQWFVCCYILTFSTEVIQYTTYFNLIKLCNTVWDLLFVEGVNVLYKAGLVFLSCLRPQILEVREFSKK